MDAITWEPPGKGPWELETTHFCRPITRFMQPTFAGGFVRGFSEGMTRYGMLLDHLKPGVVNGFIYNQPVPFGAPEGAMGPPPKPVLWLLTRLHPKIRARIATSERAFAERLWRADLEQCGDVVQNHRLCAGKPPHIQCRKIHRDFDIEALRAQRPRDRIVRV